MIRFLAATLLAPPCVAAWAQPPQIDVPEAARAVVATVDRFHAALSAGNLDQVAAELDADVVVLESGGAEHSAAEYLGHHAGADAEFLKDVRPTLRHRVARADGGIAWVATENELQGEQDGKPLAIAAAETMVLRSTASGWKIVHIHWSSRTRQP